MTKYYLDTCIWRDFYEDRFGRSGKPLGSYASKLFIKIIRKKNKILFSEVIIRELKRDYDTREIKDMLNLLFLSSVLVKVEIKEKDFTEAKKLVKEKHVPLGDALNAILARNNGAVLVTQDEHYLKLSHICKPVKPEHVI